MSYTNADGLRVLTNGDHGAVKTQGTATSGMKQVIVVDITFTALGTTFGASNIDLNNPFIPAKSLITRADLVMTSAATSGGTPTLDIGTYNAAGSAIDADGIDAAIALTAIDANGETVRCDGAHLTTAGLITADAYIGITRSAPTYTGGVGKLYVEYIKL
ncbi:hypothetical protein EKK58_08140 [Candidatus Dependentiae bacterium]|nr:MAG: hypothetical protein EKK58_08140 [Candidatus Dependentiae bacterium]